MAPSDNRPDTDKNGAGKQAAGGQLADRLDRLNRQLGGRQQSRAQAGRSGSDNSGFGQALRLSTEFVSAILVGAGLGWGIDRLAGTSPWAMIILLLLGFCAGILNVLRAAGRIADPQKQRGHGAEDKDHPPQGPSAS